MKKRIGFLIFSLLLAVTIPVNAYAMHIGEGFLPPNWCIFYFVLCAPFVYLSLKELRKLIKRDSEIKMLLAVMAAFVFMMSAMKLPSVTGSSSHPTGTGLGAIIFGPIVMVIISAIVLLFQAILLAHGGLTTLGANTLSMGIVGPLVAYGVYRLLKNRNEKVAVFAGCALGDLMTYVVTSIQLGLTFSNGEFLTTVGKFLGIFAVTQIPLAIVEGLISVVIYDFIKKHCANDLKTLEEELI